MCWKWRFLFYFFTLYVVVVIFTLREIPTLEPCLQKGIGTWGAHQPVKLITIRCKNFQLSFRFIVGIEYRQAQCPGPFIIRGF